MPEDAPAKPRKWRKRLLIAAGVVLVLLIIAWIYDFTGQRQLGGVIADLRAEGAPVTFAEMETRRKVWADDRNGANVILAVGDRLKAYRDRYTGDKEAPSYRIKNQPLGRKWPADLLADAKADLQDMVDVLTKIDTLIDYEGGRFPMKAEPNPYNILLPDLAKVRGSARLKALQTLYEVHQGQTDRLVENIRIMCRHGDLLSDDPFLISVLVQVACQALTIQTVERACALAELTPEQLKQLDKLLTNSNPITRFNDGIISERAMFIEATQLFRACRDESGFFSGMGVPEGLPRIPGASGWLARDQVAGIGLLSRLAGLTDDYVEAKTIHQQIEQDFESLPHLYGLTRMLLPSLWRAYQLCTRFIAQERCARVALAAERYRLDTGAFPKTLDALVPTYIEEWPIDPFVNEPLRYLVTESSVVVYSIGEDETDNGGDLDLPSQGKRSPDVGFQLLPPTLRGLPPLSTQPATSTAPAAENI